MSEEKQSKMTSDEWPLQPENPARRALREINVTEVEQLTGYSEKELLKLHGVGPKAIRLLRETLSARGLTFAPPDASRESK